MKTDLLTPAHAQWLAATLDRRLGKTGLQMKEGGDDTDDTGGDGGGKPSADQLGFPANTAVKDMKPEEQAAYYKHQSARHEERNKELLRITGGKYGDDLKAEFSALEKFRDKDRTEAERAAEKARQEGRSSGISDLSASAARAAFEFAFGHDPESNDKSALIDTLDLSKVLTDDGMVDTAKVRAVVKQFAPSDKGVGNQDADYGGGRRRTPSGKSGDAGSSEADRRFGKRE